MTEVPKERREKSKKAIGKKEIAKKNEVSKVLKLTTNVQQFMETQSEKLGIPVQDVANAIISNNFAVIEFDETNGRASLVYNWQGTGAVAEVTKDEKIIDEYRNLRENFAPISAGVEWHRDFTSGGGFVIHIDDIKDENKTKNAKIIENFCANVFQDSFIKGLDSILDIMIDIAITDGCDAAEIVYGIETDFNSYFDGYEEVEVVVNGQAKTATVPKFKEPEWKKLQGITRLKIIENTVNRLRPYRHPLSGEVIYFTLDEKSTTPDNAAKQQVQTYDYSNVAKKEVLKFLPWQIFWLPWNLRGTNMFGTSQIKSVYSVAKFVQAIQNAVGVGFNRWANKKYFFVCGTDKRPWGKKHFEEFMKSMERMLKNNWVGIPVPAGFEVKEIGGEASVFEGKDLLDFLTGMICAGMQYPRDFLESGRTQASDKSWLAWTVRYGRSQQMIKRCIEHQLFTRHLWCIIGKTRKVSKKGVPVNEQEEELIYIPKVMWKAEGQWLKDAKIKSLAQIMNVANPADLPLKIGVEKELAVTVGLGELDWEPTLKLADTKQKQMVIQAEIELLHSKAQLEVEKELIENGEFKKLLKIQFDNKLKQAQNPPIMNPQQQPKPEDDTEEKEETPEDKLKKQTEKRQENGVNRTMKGQPSQKGQAKSMGGSRVVFQQTANPENEELPVESVGIPPQKIEITVKAEAPKTETVSEKKPKATSELLIKQIVNEEKKGKVLDSIGKELSTKLKKKKIVNEEKKTQILDKLAEQFSDNEEETIEPSETPEKPEVEEQPKEEVEEPSTEVSKPEDSSTEQPKPEETPEEKNEQPKPEDDTEEKEVIEESSENETSKETTVVEEPPKEETPPETVEEPVIEEVPEKPEIKEPTKEKKEPEEPPVETPKPEETSMEQPEPEENSEEENKENNINKKGS